MVEPRSETLKNLQQADAQTRGYLSSCHHCGRPYASGQIGYSCPRHVPAKVLAAVETTAVPARKIRAAKTAALITIQEKGVNNELLSHRSTAMERPILRNTAGPPGVCSLQMQRPQKGAMAETLGHMLGRNRDCVTVRTVRRSSAAGSSGNT